MTQQLSLVVCTGAQTYSCVLLLNSPPEDLTLKLEHGDLWRVVTQKWNHKTLKEKKDVTVGREERKSWVTSRKLWIIQMLLFWNPSPWWSTFCSPPQGKQGSGRSKTPHCPLPPFYVGDNAGKSSLVLLHFLSVVDEWKWADWEQVLINSEFAKQKKLSYILKSQQYDVSKKKQKNLSVTITVFLYLHCNLVTFKIFEPLLLLLLLPHADPGVGDQNIAAMCRLHWIRGQNQLGTMLRKNI